jgi:hypothetical protein
MLVAWVREKLPELPDSHFDLTVNAILSQLGIHVAVDIFSFDSQGELELTAGQLIVTPWRRLEIREHSEHNDEVSRCAV